MAKTSYDLGHVPVEESVEILRGKGIGRVIYTHLNHTNPLMDPEHPATSILEKRGFRNCFRRDAD